MSSTPYRVAGRIRRCRGTLLVCGGLAGMVGLGDTCLIERARHNLDECPSAAAAREPLLGEVVALDEAGVHLLPFSELEGVGLGARVTLARGYDRSGRTAGWIGRMLDPLAVRSTTGRRRGRAPPRIRFRPVRRRPTGAGTSDRGSISACARSICSRPAVAASGWGSSPAPGVGKSTLLSMLARHSDADALVLGLIGERGREVNALLQHGLGRGRPAPAAWSWSRPRTCRRCCGAAPPT